MGSRTRTDTAGLPATKLELVSLVARGAGAPIPTLLFYDNTAPVICQQDLWDNAPRVRCLYLEVR